MSRTSWKCLLVGIVLAFALSFAAPQAKAHWGGCCRTVGWGCYSSCYVSPCYSCYSPCYSRCTSYCDTGWCGYGCRRGCGWGRTCGWGCGWGCGWSYSCGSDCGDWGYSSCCGGTPATGSVSVQGSVTPGPAPTPAN
jgi:hypothetical protein